jgi:hypothetical protein
MECVSAPRQAIDAACQGGRDAAHGVGHLWAAEDTSADPCRSTRRPGATRFTSAGGAPPSRRRRSRSCSA